MKMKKILCGIVGASMLFSQAAVFAAFPDVDEDPTVSWAKPYIDEMTSLGYIKGYEDGTFKPNKTISKVESLVLLSRMIGVNDDENEKTTEYALSEYKSVIENGSSYIISRTQLCDFMEHYVKNKEDLDNKYVAPLLSNNLFRMPKTLIITADNDPLRDEGIEYAKKLKKFLVKVKHYNFYGAAHGFLTNILDESYTELAYEKIIEFLGD